MELSSQDGDIPIPINTTTSYGGGHGHLIHHHHHAAAAHNNIIIPVASSAAAAAATLPHQINNNNNNGSSSPIPISSTNLLLEDHQNGSTNINNGDNNNNNKNNKIIIKYRECLKNHAAGMGGNATDGCGEFMPSGDEGTIEALTCSACNCHRNFHRKEFEGPASASASIYPFDYYHHFNRGEVGRKVILGHHHHHHPHKNHVLAATPEAALGYPTPTGTLISSRTGQMIMSYNNMNMGGSESDHEHEHEHEHDQAAAAAAARAVVVPKKRFRTKFTQEQKEKMLNFAEKAGWKIQKQEDSVVQHFCQEIGIKRRVLKVWMHNNKHNFAKNKHNNATTSTINIINPPPPTTTSV